MVWLLPIWLCFFMMLVGCGLLVVAGLRRFGGNSFRSPVSAFQAFWFGYAFVILFLELYSLVLPMRRPLPIALGLLALVGFWAERQGVAARLRSWRARPRLSLVLLLITLGVVLAVAGRAAQPVGWYDTHLYHLQVVKWARQFPAIPGIANLHYRLAYNNSIHLFGALTDTFWRGRASHFALGLLTSVTVVQLVSSVLRPTHRGARVAAGFCLLVLPFVLGRMGSGEIASLSSDLPLNLICIVIALELIQWRSRFTRRSDLPLALVVALATVATTTKLGGLGVLAVSGLSVLYTLFHQGWSKQRALGFAALPLALLFGYLARQTILSGWLLFPGPIGNLHLSWSLPEAETLDQFRWIQSWARIPGVAPADVLDQGLWRWFAPWYGRFAGSQEFVVLALACALAIYRLAQPKRTQKPWHAAALAATILSLVLWYRGAPDLRFGAGFFWMLLALVSAPLLGETLKEPVGRVLALSLSLGLTQWTGGIALELPHGRYWTTLPAVSKRGTEERELSPGFKALVPAGIGEGEDRCSNEPLPCTPYPVRQRLRRPNDLGSGFLF